MPLSPILIWQNRSTLEHFLILQWSLTCDTDEDCSVIKIVINGTNPLNVSYPTNSAILDTSKYASEDLIEIAIYAINKCSIMSKPSARIVNIGEHIDTYHVCSMDNNILWEVFRCMSNYLVLWFSSCQSFFVMKFLCGHIHVLLNHTTIIILIVHC